MNYRDLILYTKNKELSRKDQFSSATIGLCGEAGEVADLLKKHLFHGHTLDRDKLVKELGDVRYYLEWLCDLADVPMSEVERINTDKLLSRYPNGFSSEASINRKV
jgi:NTP pyrophosphatase (non-canonical NTP hydrolase)